MLRHVSPAAVIAIALLVALSAPAQARHHHHRPPPAATLIAQTQVLTPANPAAIMVAACPAGQHLIEAAYGVGNDVTLASATWDPALTELTVAVTLDPGWPYGTFYYRVSCR